jgi:hypothetical protein
MEISMSRIGFVCLVVALFAYVMAVAATIAAHAAADRSASSQSRQTTLNLEIESRVGATLTRVASLETGNLPKPWPAPIGHRQPRAVDVVTSTSDSPDFLDRENASVDRRIRGVCIGC